MTQRGDRRPLGYQGSSSYGVRPATTVPGARIGLGRRLVIAAVMLWIAVVSAGVVTSRPARALFGAGDVVFDPANFGEAVKSVVQASQLVAQVTQVLNGVTRIVNAFGEGGPLAALFAAAGAADEYGLLDEVTMGQETKDALKAAGEGLKAGGKLYSEIGKLGAAAQRLDRAVGQAGSWADNRPRFPGWDIVPTLGHYATTTGSRSFSYEFLSAWSARDPAMAHLVSSRSRIEREVAALDLHAISVFNSYGETRAQERNKKLLEQAQSANNSRAQLAAQQSINLAILEEIQRLNTQMAAMGRYQAGQYLGSRTLEGRPPGSPNDPMWLAPGTAPNSGADIAKAAMPPEDPAVAP